MRGIANSYAPLAERAELRARRRDKDK